MPNFNYRPRVINWGRSSLGYCENCLNDIYNNKVMEFSKKKFGETLCWTCQKKEKTLEEKIDQDDKGVPSIGESI